jgi:5-methylthioadenosine/S-adenosylhomocysteine deaminase
MKYDYLIKDCAILTLDKNLRIIEKGFIALKGSKIELIGEISSLPPKSSAEKIIEAENTLAMPGLINAHTHAAMVYFRGLADDIPLKEWLEKHIWPAEAKFVSPNFIREAVKLAALEMIKSGTTAFCDMYFAEDVAAESLKELGIRAFLGEGILDFPTPITKSPQESMERIEKFAFDYKGDELITPVVAPHAPYTCSEETLKKAASLAEKLSLPLHIHLAEEEWEVEKFKKERGMTPIAYLESIGFLGSNLSAAHVNWIDGNDIETLEKTKTSVVHNPESNMKLATGISPVPEMLKNGVNVALGTDGAASNNNLDMFGEMATAARLHKIAQKDPQAITALDVIKMATLGGAQALGAEEEIGSLEKGKRADIILINLRKAHLTPIYNFYSHLVYSAISSDVDTVIINGRVVMRNRKVLTADEEEILEKARYFAEKINS